ncbi:hypothetical protein LPB140_04170 [Sphingorhabdus lutea]|uniref:Glutamyl/glutaminyl-tRNA synthetase class Ib catalytic domain-containing protein n=2 Tax=Sphingorhabdus lutea TaxID=1913578 RepID=A0A1L3JEK6_9SPHN|nr:hypothetical protein LPB140_04170 [Sphingorhabdus lutea]
MPLITDKIGNIVTRFAPSPNGAMHMGHAFAALCAHDFAKLHDGEFMLRIEDIDGNRTRVEHVDSIFAMLNMLNITPDRVQYQSKNIHAYQMALHKLDEMGIIYPCFCSRHDIANRVKQKPVRHGPDGPNYPGTCRNIDRELAMSKKSIQPYSLRLNMAEALKLAQIKSTHLYWHDVQSGMHRADPAIFGDIIIWRKDAPASYHLASVVDDGGDAHHHGGRVISHIVRGMDLMAYSDIHILLSCLLDLTPKIYWHHPLLLDAGGEKLSKSKNSPSLWDIEQRAKDAGQWYDGFGQDLAHNLRHLSFPPGIRLSTNI